MDYLKKILPAFLIVSLPTIVSAQEEVLYTHSKNTFILTQRGASYLASLPLKCLDKEFPYKTGITFLDSSFTTRTKNYHPAFFGCYDWHSSVHGHWMLVKLMKQFPSLPESGIIKEKLSRHLTKENISKEIEIFKADNLGLNEHMDGPGSFSCRGSYLPGMIPGHTT